MQTYLVIGNCGVGKTWLMKKIIEALGISRIYSYKKGLYTFLKQRGVAILGKYDDSVFEGGDLLSMAIMKDNANIKKEFANDIVICEGDRFTNSTFIADFQPIIFRIKGDGSEGRKLRGSSQTERHLKSIATRVNNIPAVKEFENSQECFDYIIAEITPHLK